MQTVTSSDLKQNSMRLQDALRGDLLVTKRDTPFVVVMDYEKYRLIEQYIHDMTKSSMSKESLREILENSSKKELNLTIFDRGEKLSDFSREDAYRDAF
ncbi:MAG: type II toxin-antitoxin system Phd/YefM family antitoxin [Epsilonproteobacteria bacterium]|nr:type II toxin-antitoxin system Phd/YefM family antitoxin [Campylobacterota bacterium]